MIRRNIRKKVLIPLTLTFLVLFSAFLYSGYSIREEKIALELAHRYDVAKSTLSEVVERRVETMRNVASFLAHDKIAQEAMRRGDRQALYRQASPSFARMAEHGGITHLYYHTPQGYNFLRAYRPDVFGDLVTRQTLRQARKSGEPTHGLELGDLGTMTLRLVLPWHDEQGRLLGFIELGTEIENLLAALRRIGGFDYIVTIEKGYLERAKWEEGMRLLARPAEWDRFPSKVVIDSSVELPTPSLTRIFGQDHLPVPGETWEEARGSDGRRFAVRRLVLAEAGGRVVGDYFLFYDTTAETTTFYTFIIRVVGIGLLLSLVLFIFAWRILGKTDRELSKTTQQLLDDKAVTEGINLTLAEEIERRRQVEEELHQLNEQLEERVSERTRKLEEAHREIECSRNELAVAYADLQAKQATILHQDKMACIGQLAAGVAHDINNPVGFVSHNLVLFERYLQQLVQFIALQEELLKSRGDSDLRAAWDKGRRDFTIDRVFQEMAEMLNECRDGTARITQIVQSLRGFSRQEQPQRQLTDLHRCLESTLTIIRPELHGKIEVIREYGTLPLLFCHAEQLNQVFMNLLINGAQAIAGAGRIRIRTWSEKEQLYIAISDNGCGIPPERLERIFEPFYTTKPIGVGTGLGLSISYDIVARHKGEILAESEPGLGSTFTVRLPCDIRAANLDPDDGATRTAVADQTVPGVARD